jgi:hypothetical protein
MLMVAPNVLAGQSRLGPVGPGKGGVEGGHIIGQFAEWDRRATPMLVLRIHGAGMLQTFAEISATGKFKLPFPEVPAEGNFGSTTCGNRAIGLIVVATDVSLLTNLPGFASPGRWDRGLSEIGMALLADEAFSGTIGRPGGKRAHWMYTKVARTVAVGECNNRNSFRLESGWNAYTVVSGPDGGPHTYEAGLDGGLGWYWYAFSEDAAIRNSPTPTPVSGTPVPADSVVEAKWLPGEWDGVQADVLLKMRLDSSGAVLLESAEGGRTQTTEGKWSLIGGEFVLNIREGVLRFNIKRLSETSFGLFGKDASSDIIFTRRP